MRVAIHQPDLLPWSGFWFKMTNADAFVVAIHEQLTKHGVQRRVAMRDTWVTLPVVGKPRLVPITEVQVKDGWQQHLVDSIRGRYVGAKHWKTRGPDLLERIQTLEGTGLAEINVAMIELVRDLLGITTPLLFTPPPEEAGAERVLEQLVEVGATSYLSGRGALDYLDEAAQERFRELGIELVWSRHHKTSGDSVVTLLMDYDDPMEIISMSSDEGY